jgi:hypothetical protein
MAGEREDLIVRGFALLPVAPALRTAGGPARLCMRVASGGISIGETRGEKE